MAAINRGQAELDFYEDVYEALKAAVNHLKGAKVVGHMLWPKKSMEEARSRLLNCLDKNRDEKLDPEETIFILRTAKEAGFYSAQAYFDHQCGYQAGSPMNLAEEERALTAVIESATATLDRAIGTLERIRSGKALAP